MIRRSGDFQASRARVRSDLKSRKSRARTHPVIRRLGDFPSSLDSTYFVGLVLSLGGPLGGRGCGFKVWVEVPLFTLALGGRG
jgi:hypothetical protein